MTASDSDDIVQNMTVSEIIVREIRAEMARQRKSQRELAAVLGASPATTTRRLAGSIPFSVAELAKVSDWLDVPVGDFLNAGRTGVMPTKPQTCAHCDGPIGAGRVDDEDTPERAWCSDDCRDNHADRMAELAAR